VVAIGLGSVFSTSKCKEGVVLEDIVAVCSTSKCKVESGWWPARLGPGCEAHYTRGRIELDIG